MPRLELMILGKDGMAEAFPYLEGMLDSFVGKMVTKVVNKLTVRLGLNLEDLIAFMKTAENRPAGSAAFQANHTILCRGQLPLEKLVTPEAEAIITELNRSEFGLRWGEPGLTIQVQCCFAQLDRLAPKLVRLGTLFTQGAGD